MYPEGIVKVHLPTGESGRHSKTSRQKWIREIEDNLAGMTVGELSAYIESRAIGESVKMSLMLAKKKAPGIMTDSVFMAGVGTLADQFEDGPMMGKYIRTARANGGNPRPTDLYVPALAQYPGDPRAFVSSRKEIKDICAESGLDCEGAVTYNGYRSPDTDPMDGKTKLSDLIG